MPYDINTTGLTDIKRAFPWAKQKLSRVPLVGLVDGTNQTFHTRHYPLAGVSFYNSAGSGLAYDSLDDETGAVVFSAAPAGQPYGDYTFVERTDSELTDLLQSGFDELESRWARGWKLVTSGDALYVEDDDGADPTVYGSTVFSDSRAAINLLLICTRYRYLEQQQGYASIHGLSYRQEGGFSADNRQRAKDLASALAALSARIDDAITSFLIGLDPSEFGGGILSPKTDTYRGVFRWQRTTGSAIDDGTGEIW